jgi:DNA-binding NarL/FixJ family response regulator
VTPEGKVRVLIVDDQRYFADALKLFLDRDPSLRVVGIAENGRQAVDMAVSEDADVVLMDIGLPISDGFDATQRLLALKRAAKVIAVTGRRREEISERAREAGMVSYLSKNLIHEHVRDAIERAWRGEIEWEVLQ